MPIMRPQPNCNGTCREQLIEHRLKTIKLIALTIEALRETAPHGRDYQTVPDFATRFEADRDIFRARLRTLESMSECLMSEAIDLRTGEL